MHRTERESREYQCEKLGGIAHVNVEYFHGEESRFIFRFDCDRASDCGIRRSPFSGTPNYAMDCPLYNDLANNLSWRMAS